MTGEKSGTTSAQRCARWINQWEWIFREVRTNNIVRAILLQRPARIRQGPVARTPRQQRRHFKKKRIHKEWRVKRKWANRKDIRMWKRQVDEFKTKYFLDTMVKLTSAIYASQQLKKNGR